MDPTRLKQTLEVVLAEESVIANAETIVNSPGKTIEPRTRQSVDQARTLLERLRSTREELDTRFRVESTLGHGGMGVVRMAEQASLGRKVAVKTLRPDRAKDEAAVVKMLQEAWITGSLEHPNVVPIYDMHVDEEGRPHIVLKRIDGVPWDELIHDAKGVRRRFGADDLLEWNLSILMQVCNAIAFAHSRGIVHRDLKPENIMIGEFGEVYILDWGIAVCVDDDHDGRFPHVSSAKDMAGTPCYMAPEMLGGDQVRIGRHSDIYLIGAILYELVSGVPPHDGDSLQEIVGKIILSEPPFDDDAPDELVRIVRRAMDPDPHARFENAVQIRLALQAFLKHQGSRRLAELAEKRRDELSAEIERVGLSDDPAAQALLQALFAECRFGFAEALRAWPDNQEAAHGLREVTVKMVEYQLAIGQPRVAAASLAGIFDPPPSLLSRVDEAVRKKDAEHKAREQLGRELDPNAGRLTRTFLALVTGSMWSVSPLLRYVTHVDERFGIVWAPTLFLLFGMGLFLWARESMTKTALNRFIVAAVGSILGVEIVFALAALKLGLPEETVHVLTFALWWLGSILVTIVAQWRLFPIPLGYFAGFLVVAVHPEWRYVASACCHFVTTVVTVSLWAPPEILIRWLDRIDPGRNQSMAVFRLGKKRDDSPS